MIGRYENDIFTCARPFVPFVNYPVLIGVMLHRSSLAFDIKTEQKQGNAGEQH